MLSSVADLGGVLLPFGERPESRKVGNQLLATGCDRVSAGNRWSGIDAPFDQAGVLEFA